MIGQVLEERYHLNSNRLMFTDNRLLKLARREHYHEIQRTNIVFGGVGLYVNIDTYYDDDAGLGIKFTTFKRTPYRIAGCA